MIWLHKVQYGSVGTRCRPTTHMCTGAARLINIRGATGGAASKQEGVNCGPTYTLAGQYFVLTALGRSDSSRPRYPFNPSIPFLPWTLLLQQFNRHNPIFSRHRSDSHRLFVFNLHYTYPNCLGRYHLPVFLHLLWASDLLILFPIPRFGSIVTK